MDSQPTNPDLQLALRRYLAEASVATRALQGNPLLTEAGGRASQ